jgi:murein DD-endopeptidase MepM/ murein hydrolase activator NlpD
MKLDLINQFGPAGAAQIMSNLEKGGGAGDLGTFTYGAFNLNTSNEKASSQMGMGLSYLSDQAIAAWNQGGAPGYARSQIGGLGNLISQVGIANMGAQLGDPYNERKQLERNKQLQDAISAKYGFDVSGLVGVSTMPTGTALTYAQNAQKAGLDRNVANMVGGAVSSGAGLTNLLQMAGVKDTTLTGKEAFDALVKALTEKSGPGEDPFSFQSRIRGLGRAGTMFENSRAVQSAILNPEDQNKQYRAVNEMLREFEDLGMTAPQITKAMGDIKATVGDPTSAEYILANAVIGKSQQELGYQMPFMTRTQQFGAQANLFQAQRATIMGNPGDPNRAANMEQATDTFMQAANAQGEYFKQLLYQQREFNVSMQRAQEDFAIQRSRMEQQYNISRSRAQQDFSIQRQQQEYDYHLSRRRAEFDFNLARDRSTQQFHRSLKRGYEDYTLGRKRQEQDFNHQVRMMAEQSARSMYDIYKRVQVQQTNSATWLLVNNQDQVKRMREQESNLSRLRKMGLSDDAIQQMGLTDSANAQQLARFVTEVAADPKLIKQFNEAVRDRIKSASKLTKDESSQEWEEFQRQYEIARKRGAEDFKKSVARSHQDFKIQMGQMEDDFRRSMSRQAEDFQTAEDRQQAAFSRSMHRAAQDYGISVAQMQSDFSRSMNRAQEDLARSSQEITGDLETILEKATNKLAGHAGKQAGIVLDALRGLDLDAQRAGIQLMEHFANIFGIKYNPPKIHKPPQVSNQGGHEPTSGVYAAGGVLPGYTPGRDVHHYYGQDGSKLSLSGGEAIMVPEWVRAMGGPRAIKEMNHAARHGQLAFAGGGTFWPLPNSTWSTYPGHDGIDLNAPNDNGKPFYAAKAGTIGYTGWDHGYGDAIFETGPYGTVVYGHGSKVAVRAGQKVAAGQYIGNVGSTGHSTGPHLHFGFPGGTPQEALALLAGALRSGYGAAAGGSVTGTGATKHLADVLKDRYPALERAAAKMKLGGGFPDGWWSDKMNEYARVKWAELKDKYGTNLTQNHTDTPPAPQGVSSTQALVRKAMLQAGFSADQWDALFQLVMHESGFRPDAQNPTSSAYGLFQFLDSTWAGVGGHKTSDPWLQSVYGMRYIKERYGNPQHAWDMWQSRSPHWYGEGAVFNGPQTIGVGEKGPSNPQEFITQLRQRQRVLALSNPAQGGTKL